MKVRMDGVRVWPGWLRTDSGAEQNAVLDSMAVRRAVCVDDGTDGNGRSNSVSIFFFDSRISNILIVVRS